MKRAVKIAVSLLYGVADDLWRRARALAGAAAKPRLIILYYHAVRDVDRANFARQLDALRSSGARVVAPDYRGGEPNETLIAITFDDAFMSVVDNALPELAVREMPATIFAPAAQLGRSPNWDMEGDAEDRKETIASSACLQNIRSSRVTIGAHSASHPHLPRLTREEQKREVESSRAELERVLGERIDLFAFPYGEYDEVTVELCRQAGYRHAFTVSPQIVDPQSSDLLRGRVVVNPSDSLLEFGLKMRGAYVWMAKASALKAALRGRRSRVGRPA